MICTQYNRHIIKLLKSPTILWKCILDDGTEVLSDFDMEDMADPWTRLKEYCIANKRNIVEARAMPPGMPEFTVYKDVDGLDGLLLKRGAAKSLLDGVENNYQFLVFGLLQADGMLHVKNFYWPQCELGLDEEIRELTEENKLIIWRRLERK